MVSGWQQNRLYAWRCTTLNFDIYSMDADGGNRLRLTEHAERDQRAAWSPDGQMIAFESQRDGDKSIWLMDADGSNKRKVVEGREPSWSPDGKQIAFTSSAFDGNDEIYLAGVDGSNRVRLTENKKRLVCLVGSTR